MELGHDVIEKIRQVRALGNRIERVVGAVRHHDRVAAVDRIVRGVRASLQRRNGFALRVEHEIAAVRTAHERKAVRKRAGCGKGRGKRRRAVLLDEGVKAGRGVPAQQQTVLKKALRARIRADFRAGERVVDAVIGVAVGHHVVREIDRNRRLGVVDDELALTVDDRCLPLVVLDRRESAGREIARRSIRERQNRASVLIEITRTGHAVNIRAARREDISHSARRRHDGKHRKNGAEKFFHHSIFHPCKPVAKLTFCRGSVF